MRALIIITIIFLFAQLKSQQFTWAKRGGLWAYDYGYGITTDNYGNVYVSGKYEMNANFSGTILPCQGNHDIFLAQYNPTGNLNWIRTAGGYTGDYATCVSTDKTNFVYIAGEIEGTNANIKFQGSPITLTCQSSNDIFLAKYTLSGNLVWAKRAGGYDYEKALGICNDAAGNVYICGLFRGSAKFGGVTTIYSSGDNDIFIAKYDANGNFLWVKKAGSSGRDEAKAIQCDANGNVYITGLYKNACSFGSQILYAPNGFFNAFVARYSPNGDLAWVKSGGGNYDDVGWGLTVDASNRIYICGEFNATAAFGSQSIWTNGSADVFVACYDSNGNIIWIKKAGGSGVDRARGIGSVGNKIFITGQFAKTAYFGAYNKTAVDNSDIFMAGLDNNGNFLWLNAAGGGSDAYEDLGYESGNAICAESNGNVYATGSMLSGASFGTNFLSSWTRTDVFVTKITTSPSQIEEVDWFSHNSLLTNQFLIDTPTTEMNDDSKFKIYPNPSNGFFSIYISDENDEVETEIYNSQGILIQRILIQPQNEIRIDLSQRERGVYTIYFRKGEIIIRKKILIE
ncbi:MAG: T9SS type A sorting domain-containing protein [Bacteroidota bacterium]|jgi:hypothetical protein